MRSARPAIVFMLLLGALALPIMISAKRYSNAQSQLESAQAGLSQTINDAQRIVELRAQQQTIAEHKRPDQDVIARVNAVLAEAGIPSDRFGGLRPEADMALPNSGSGSTPYRRQSVRITLNELSVLQIGEFFYRWNASQPLWISTRIELTHSRTAQNTGLYSLNVLLSATYVAHAEQPESKQS